MKWLYLLILFGLVSVLGAGSLYAEGGGDAKALTVDEIVQKANRAAYYKGKDGRADVTMVIRDSQGRERKRSFTILRSDVQPEGDKADENCGEQKFYIYFSRPADVNKMAYLVWKHIDKDDDRWLYMPALDLNKRVAAGDKRTSFVGSDFYYEDVSGRNVTADKHELVETTENYYVLKNTPKDADSVEFSYFKAWIHRGTFLPVKVEYYDKAGEKYRVYSALKVEKVDGFDTVTEAKMSDLKTKNETVISYANVKYNIGLEDAVFTEQFLRNPPKKYLRK